MPVLSQAGQSVPRRPATANDLLRTRWRPLFWYGTLASLVGHVLVITLTPAWEWGQGVVLVAREPLRIERLPTVEPPEEPAEVEAEAAAPAETASDEPEAGAGGSGTETGTGLADLLDLLRDRMPGSFTPVAAQEGDGTPTADYDSALGGITSQLDQLESLPLDLSRLSTVSPELALGTAVQGWPLIRNPNQVVRFIRSGQVAYDRARRADAPEGLVTVAMWIDRNGSVEWAEVHESSGDVGLDEIALDVLSRVAEFRPVRSQGASGMLALLVSIRFPF